jgi:hypothetical protein
MKPLKPRTEDLMKEFRFFNHLKLNISSIELNSKIFKLHMRFFNKDMKPLKLKTEDLMKESLFSNHLKDFILILRPSMKTFKFFMNNFKRDAKKCNNDSFKSSKNTKEKWTFTVSSNKRKSSSFHKPLLMSNSSAKDITTKRI